MQAGCFDQSCVDNAVAVVVHSVGSPSTFAIRVARINGRIIIVTIPILNAPSVSICIGAAAATAFVNDPVTIVIYAVTGLGCARIYFNRGTSY